MLNMAAYLRSSASTEKHFSTQHNHRGFASHAWEQTEDIQTLDNFICPGIWQQHNVYEARNTSDG